MISIQSQYIQCVCVEYIFKYFIFVTSIEVGLEHLTLLFLNTE